MSQSPRPFIVLADRPVHSVIHDMGKNFALPEIMSLMNRKTELADAMKSLKTGDEQQGIRNLIATMEKISPSMVNVTVPQSGFSFVNRFCSQVLIHERSKAIMSQIEQAKQGPIVAMVGMAHLDDIDKLSKNEALPAPGGFFGFFKR